MFPFLLGRNLNMGAGVIQDVTFILPSGEKHHFQHVGSKKIFPLTDTIAMMELTSALGMAQGFVVLAPGTVIRYDNQNLTTHLLEGETSNLIIKDNGGSV
jgi:hypothetical protein